MSFLNKYFNLQKKVVIENNTPPIFDFNEANSGDVKNPDIFNILTDPEFYKTFPGPADFQYSILRNNFLEDSQSTKNSLGLLKNILHDESKTIFSKVLLLKWLRTAIGGYPKMIEQYKSNNEISKILESGISSLQSLPETPYLLSVYLQKNIFFKQVSSFESQEVGLTPIKITDNIYIQDNKFDPIPIFYHVINQRAFDLLVKEQQSRFDLARPENRPELPKNLKFKELKEYNDKYINAQIYLDSYLEEIRAKKEEISYKFKTEELLQYFPNSKNSFELTQDEQL